MKFLLPTELAEMEHKYIIKAEAQTNPEYGYLPSERPLEYLIDTGIVNINKVAGPSSHVIASWVKQILGINKTGHGGTLDPNVTGVLPVVLGSATKVVSALQTAGKEYICLLNLHKDIELEKIQKALNIFTCEIYQRPPLKSAVARRIRKRTIYYIEFLEKRGTFILFRVGCQSGTYIRKLCHDIGEILLCGGSMAELRRTKSGSFVEGDYHFTLQDLKDAVRIYREEKDERFLRKIIFPMEKSVKHWKKIYIRDNAVDAIAHGAKLAVSGVLYLEKSIEKKEKVAIVTQKGELVAFAEANMSASKIIEFHTGICATPNKVFIPRGLYPSWKDIKEKKLDLVSEKDLIGDK